MLNLGSCSSNWSEKNWRFRTIPCQVAPKSIGCSASQQNDPTVEMCDVFFCFLALAAKITQIMIRRYVRILIFCLLVGFLLVKRHKFCTLGRSRYNNFRFDQRWTNMNLATFYRPTGLCFAWYLHESLLRVPFRCWEDTFGPLNRTFCWFLGWWASAQLTLLKWLLYGKGGWTHRL